MLPRDPSQPGEKPQLQVQVHKAQLPREGDPQAPADSRPRSTARSRSPAGPTAAALPPPRSPAVSSLTWTSRACLPQPVACRPGLYSPGLVPASHTGPEPTTPPAPAGASARARKRAPASPLALQAPAPLARRPRRQGRASRCRPPGRTASCLQRSTSCSR